MLILCLDACLKGLSAVAVHAVLSGHPSLLPCYMHVGDLAGVPNSLGLKVQ